jgi:hypothetical protein
VQVILAAALSVIVAAAAFALSFSALADLARMTGIFPEPLPALLPIVIDVFMIQASYSLVVAAAAGDQGSRHYHWCILAVSSSVSIVLNCYHAWVASGQVLPAAVSAGIASIPPLALLASTHGLIVHLSTSPTATSRASHAQSQVNAPSSEEGEGAPEHDAPRSEHGPDDSVHHVHQSARPTVSEVVITDAHLAQARLLKSTARLTKTERDVATVLALHDADYSPREIEAALPGIGHRTTIARWLQTADDLRSTDGLETAAEPTGDHDGGATDDWTLTPA